MKYALLIICTLSLLTGCEATNSDTVTAPDPAIQLDNSAWYKFKMEALESKR